MSEHGTQPAAEADAVQEVEVSDRRSRKRRSASEKTGAGPEPALNMDELRELVELIGGHGFTDFEIEREGLRIRLRRELAPHQAQAAPLTTQVQPLVAVDSTGAAAKDSAAPTAAANEAQETAADEALLTITSPIVGTFYRAPTPGADPFVKLGSAVTADSVVCIIEAMKLMNEIQAELSGEIVKIFVENGQPVEFGQPLFGVRR